MGKCYIPHCGWEVRRSGPPGLSTPPGRLYYVHMHLLYLDDSGDVKNSIDRHVVLAGLEVFERQPHWFSQKLDAIAERLSPEGPAALEFRGVDILSGRKRWRGIPRPEREAAYGEALEILRASARVRLFGAAIYKSAVSPDDPMEYAFEQLCNRFDRYLGRLHKAGDTQRGIIVLDESTYETSLQSLARDFRTDGHRWGQLYNLSEVPLFVDSRATRMIQYADLVAHTVRQYFEHGESKYFDIIADKFDAVGGVIHGLVHYAPADAQCNCLVCRQRRAG